MQKYTKGDIREVKSARLWQLSEANPDWGYTRLNRALKDEFGSGMRKQAMLSELRTEIRPFIAKKVSGIIHDSPRTKTEYIYPTGTKWKPKGIVQRMPANRSFEIFADVKFNRKVTTKKGNKLTQYTTVYVGTYSQSQLFNIVKSGKAGDIINRTINDLAGKVGYSIEGFWRSKEGFKNAE